MSVYNKPDDDVSPAPRTPRKILPHPTSEPHRNQTHRTRDPDPAQSLENLPLHASVSSSPGTLPPAPPQPLPNSPFYLKGSSPGAFQPYQYSPTFPSINQTQAGLCMDKIVLEWDRHGTEHVQQKLQAYFNHARTQRREAMQTADEHDAHQSELLENGVSLAMWYNIKIQMLARAQAAVARELWATREASKRDIRLE